jgi:cell filamentation protein
MIEDKVPKKQRILVMNGQRLIQEQKGEEWATQKVGKAGRLKPGIYHAYLAKDADQALQHTGVVFHADDKYVYQQEAQGITQHPLQSFSSVPEYGRPVCITYEEGRAVAIDTVLGLSQKRSR